MDTTLLIFIFVSTMQAVIFGFSLVLIKSRQKAPVGATNYNVDAATKLAEHEAHINGLRLDFNEVIDRLEKWTKRDKQRSNREEKAQESVLPTDGDLAQGVAPGNSQIPGRGGKAEVFARLRASKGI